MSDSLQKLRILSRTEIALLKIHLHSAARQALLYAAGLLLMLLTVAAINVALFLYLSERLEGDTAALIVAVINAVLALGLFLMAKRTQPGPEAAMVEEVRDLAVAELQADAEVVRGNLNAVIEDVQRIRSSFGGLFGSGGPLRGLTQLGSLLDLVTGALRRSK